MKEIKIDKRQTILIVDDAEFNRDILKEFLGETYNYLEAENGNQAIQIMGGNPGIDLMLLDINMLSSEESVDTMRKAYIFMQTRSVWSMWL